jgi:hypothetical protein
MRSAFRSSFIVTSGALLLGFSSVYAAPDPCGCNAGLVKEVTKREQSSSVSLAFLEAD